jgi:2-dehydro-3-deoxyphosphogluconate aldolase/(4S)-4-hydroxy-2-oxoglutarate aldolase
MFQPNPLSEAVIPIMELAPVIPVIRIDDPGSAVPLAAALVEGGLRVLEITLRTEHGLAAIGEIARALPEAVVGAGTVLNPAQMASLDGTGCRFIVSPGFTPALLDAAERQSIPFLPAAVTPAEVLTLLSRGYVRQKFFPAEPAGGIPMLKSIRDPIPQVRFCPTGGIDLAKAPAYLALPNVACVGGSWVVPADAIRARDWARITQLATEAASLRSA